MAHQTAVPAGITETALQDIINKRKGKRKSGMYLLLGVAGVMSVFATIKAMSTYHPKMVEVAVLTSAVQPGTRIRVNAVRYRNVSADLVTSKMFQSCEHLIGRVVRESIPMGEPILDDDLLPENMTFSTRIRPGYRAVSVEVSADGGIDNCFIPGDHVDVAAVVDKDGRKYTRVIAEDAEVMCATRADDGRTTGRPRRTTLEVPAAEAETVSEAAEVGKIRFLLRNPVDRAHVVSEGRSDDDVLPAKARVQQAVMAPPPPPQIQPPPPQVREPVLPPPPAQTAPVTPRPSWTVEVFSGSSRRLQEFYDSPQSSMPAEPTETPSTELPPPPDPMSMGPPPPPGSSQ